MSEDDERRIVALDPGKSAADRAIDRAERAARASPDDVEALSEVLTLRLRRALERLDSERHAEALEDVERLLEHDVIGCHVHVLHAWALAGVRDRAGACRAIEKAIEEATPECEPRLLAMAAFVARDLDRDLAMRAIDRAKALHPREPDVWSTSGRLRSDGSPEELADYARALELEPAHAEALALRAKVLSGKRHGELEAQRDVQRAARLAPDDDVVLEARAAVMSNVGRHAEAARDLERVAELRGDDPEAHVERAEALERAGDDRAAVDAWTKAIQRDGSRGYLYARRGRALDRIGNAKGALRDLDTAVAKDPGLLSWRADLHEAHGRLVKAVADLDRALALMPDEDELDGDEDEYEILYERVGLIARRGWLKLAMHREGKPGMLAKAEKDFEKALAIDTSCADACAGRGAVRMAKGDLVGALRDLDDAIEYDGSEASQYVERAAVHVALGNTEKAIADLEDAVEKGDLAAKEKLLALRR